MLGKYSNTSKAAAENRECGCVLVRHCWNWNSLKQNFTSFSCATKYSLQLFCSHLTILLISFSIYSQCSQLRILIFLYIFRYIKWLGLSPPWLGDARKGVHLSQTDLCDGNTCSCTREVTSTPKLTQKSTHRVRLLHLLPQLSTNEIQLRCQSPQTPARA